MNRIILSFIILFTSFAFSTEHNSNIYNLGRDNDPKTINDISPFKLWLKK